jgi:hypothetical protein
MHKLQFESHGFYFGMPENKGIPMGSMDFGIMHNYA